MRGSVIILLSLVACLAASVSGQRPARIGPDGKPLLNRPILDECMNRTAHLHHNGHAYFMSWREPWNRFENWDWFNGRNFCRERCMDLVSIEDAEEYKLIAAIIAKDQVKSVYTSGRKCNFRNKGCEADHLNPINVKGWFWAGASNTRIEETDKSSPNSFWSHTGETSRSQPDNFEGLRAGPIETEFDVGITIEGLQEYYDEACLAVRNQAFGDGIKWHDVACHFRSPIICEDSDQMMALAGKISGVNVDEVKNAYLLTEDKIDAETLNVRAVLPLISKPRSADRPRNNFLSIPPPPGHVINRKPQRQINAVAPHKIQPQTHHVSRAPLAPKRLPRHPVRQHGPPFVPQANRAPRPAPGANPSTRHRLQTAPQKMGGFFKGLKNMFGNLL